MAINLLLKSLKLPTTCVANQKLPKAFFKRNFELTLSEKKLIDDFSIVQQLEIVALINHETANIPAFNDATTSYEEIVVLAVQTTNEQFDRQHNKIIELIHKYIPNPIVLIVYDNQKLVLSVAEKRINNNDNTKRVIEKIHTTIQIALDNNTKINIDFLESIAFDKAIKINLKQFYENYLQSIIGLQTAQLNGTFAHRPIDRSKQDLLLLEQIELLQQEITTLQIAAKKETQVAQLVQHNTQIQNNRLKINKLTQNLTN